MLTKLKVSFSDPEHGWISLTVNYNLESFNVDVADVPSDSLLNLTAALHNLFLYDGQAAVTWHGEPIEYDMLFSRNDTNIILKIYEYPDHRRGSERGKRVCVISGAYDDVCLPFWRALKNLQSRFVLWELSTHWTYPFPSKQIDSLTSTIKGRH